MLRSTSSFLKEGKKNQRNKSNIDFSFKVIDENQANVSKKTNASRNASMGVAGVFSATEVGPRTP